MDNQVIFEKGQRGRNNSYIAKPKIDYQGIPRDFLRDSLDLPCLGELEVVRHYAGLARKNFSVDTNFYPLGSCTMKYNPKINEYLSGLSGFCDIHPDQPQDSVQGALEVLFNLEQMLCEITGMKRFTFQPSSGAQGELTGMLMINKCHQANKSKRNKVIVPDSAHGTNPATAAMCGYEIVVVPSTADGLVDIEKLKREVEEPTAAIMLTNPNTLGLFEENILDIARIIHDKGGLLYYDGANFNPLLGITKISLMGFDVIHLNLHKTFSTPHGCGGPGAGAVGVSERLAEFLPAPVVVKNGGKYSFDYRVKNSIGRVRSFYGNFGVLVRAYAYLLRLGSEGLLAVAQNSVINANYIMASLKDIYQPCSARTCMHEVVFSCVKQKERGASALDIAKRLIDFDIHPPTMYFPMIVKEALMVEPTETESKDTLDYFIKCMRDIDKEIDADLAKLKDAPSSAAVKRVDDVKAARSPNLKW